MGALGTAGDGFKEAWALLSHQWQMTASLWHDAVQRRFDRTYIEAYEPAIFAVQRALGELEAVIAQARRNVK